MKTSVKAGFIFSLIWIIINMIVYLAGFSIEFFRPGIMVNFFLLMACIAVGLYVTKKEKNYKKGFFLDDFKTALQCAIIYALTVSAFAYAYHEFIDDSIKTSMADARIADLHEKVPNEEAFQEYQAQDITWKNKSFDDFIENKEDEFRSVFSSFSVFVGHLMGLTFMGGLFAFAVTLILRKVVLREHT
ncbi:MAG: DUF4199 family protein [Crocinitomicaceae bacterium]